MPLRGVVRLRLAAAAGAAVLLAGCSGSSGSLARGSLQNAMLPQPGAAASAAPLSPVSFSVKVPATNGASAGRSPQYISPGIASIAVTAYSALGTPPPSPTAVIDLTSAANCGGVTSGPRTCTVSFQAPVGNALFAVAAYDQPPTTAGAVQGNVLARTNAAAAANIMPNVLNTVSIALGGVPASLQFLQSRIWIPSTGSMSVPVIARDAAGYTIFGYDAFPTPISVTKSDPSNGLTLGTTTLTSPSSNSITLSVSNPAAFTRATLIATSGAATAKAIVDPAFYIFAGTSSGYFEVIDPIQAAVVGYTAVPAGPGPIVTIDTTGANNIALIASKGTGFYQISTAKITQPSLVASSVNVNAQGMMYGGPSDPTHAYGFDKLYANLYNLVLSGTNSITAGALISPATSNYFGAISHRGSSPDCAAFVGAIGSVAITQVQSPQGTTATAAISSASGSPLNVAMNQQGTVVAVSMGDGSLSIIGLSPTCAPLSVTVPTSTFAFNLTGPLAFSPDGNTLYAPGFVNGLNVLEVFSVLSGPTVAYKFGIGLGTSFNPYSVAVTPNGLTVVLGGNGPADNTVRLIDPNSYGQIAAYSLLNGSENASALTVQAR